MVRGVIGISGPVVTGPVMEADDSDLDHAATAGLFVMARKANTQIVTNSHVLVS